MRKPKPFRRKQTQTWYVQIGRKQINLGPDEAAAWQEYYRLMAGAEPATPKTTAHEVIDQFLAWSERNQSPGTYTFYWRHIKGFKEHVGARLRAFDLKPLHVQRWIDDQHASHSDTYKHNAIRCVQRAFKWAADQGYIPRSPIASIKKPEQTPREIIIEPDQWLKIVAAIPDQQFLDFVTTLKETGARPQEVRVVEARDIDRARRQWIFERRNSKGKKVRRVVRLNAKAWEITQRLLLKNPDGPLFRNVDGKPWRKDSINCRFYRLRKKLGFRVFAYSFRHTWATEAIKRGVDLTTVAIFLGHRDATMLMKVYGHLTGDNDYLDEQLKRATGT